MNWRPLPTRIISDRRFIALALDARGVLLSLYLACDMHGRIDADETVLRFRLFYLDGEELRTIVRQLATDGFLHLYTRDGGVYCQIDKWDQDLTPSMRGKRGASHCPDPPDEIFERAGCIGSGASPRESARNRASSRETARDESEPREPAPRKKRKNRSERSRSRKKEIARARVPFEFENGKEGSPDINEAKKRAKDELAALVSDQS